MLRLIENDLDINLFRGFKYNDLRDGWWDVGS